MAPRRVRPGSCGRRAGLRRPSRSDAGRSISTNGQQSAVRHRFGLPAPRLPDPRRHRGGRAGRTRARRDAAGERTRRHVAGCRGGGGDRRHALTGRSSRRQLRRDRRRDRPAAQRPRLFARDAGGRRGAPRTDRVHRPAHCAGTRRRLARGRRGDRGRRHRDRARPADRRSQPARGRSAGGRAHPGRGGPAHGRCARAASGLRRRVDADGLRHRRRTVLAPRGGRPAVRLEQPERDPGRGAVDRLAVLRDHAGAARRPGPGHARPRAAQDLGGDHRLHARSPADRRRRPRQQRDADRGRQRRLAGRPRDDVGSGRGPRRRGPHRARRRRRSSTCRSSASTASMRRGRAAW